MEHSPGRKDERYVALYTSASMCYTGGVGRCVFDRGSGRGLSSAVGDGSPAGTSMSDNRVDHARSEPVLSPLYPGTYKDGLVGGWVMPLVRWRQGTAVSWCGGDWDGISPNALHARALMLRRGDRTIFSSRKEVEFKHYIRVSTMTMAMTVSCHV